MQYYQAVNYGKGFITHEDNVRSQITGWPADIWTTEDNAQWAARVNATTLTKQQAQALVDAVNEQAERDWEVCVEGTTPWLCGPRPEWIELP